MRNIIHGNTYNDYQLSRTNKNDQGFYSEILEGIESLLNRMTQRHGSVFFTMFVLTYPSEMYLTYPDDNALFTRFIEGLTRNCKRNGLDPKYLWAREYSSTGQVHYHFVLLLNGSKTQNAHGLHQKVIKLWGGCLGINNAQGYVELCKKGKYFEYGGVKVRRNAPNFPEVFAECFQRASYLAKCHSKGASPVNVNEFGTSRLS